MGYELGLSLLQTVSIDRHLWRANNRIDKTPEISIWSLNFQPPTYKGVPSCDSTSLKFLCVVHWLKKLLEKHVIGNTRGIPAIKLS